MSTKKKAVSAKSAAASLQGKTENLPAVIAPGAMSLPGGYVPVRNLQMPSLVMKKPGEQRLLRFTSSLQVSGVKPKPNEAPATVADVVDVQSGELFKFLVPAVVESSIVQTYGAPGDQAPSGKDRDDTKKRQQVYDGVGIQGRVLAIRNAGKREGKRHVDFEVVEVAPKAE